MTQQNAHLGTQYALHQSSTPAGEQLSTARYAPWMQLLTCLTTPSTCTTTAIRQHTAVCTSTFCSMDSCPCILLLQLAVLEMVGQRRHHGAVQTDMANELGVQHRNFFYVLKVG